MSYLDALERGTRAEQREHGISRALAMKLAADHLRANPAYYESETIMPKNNKKPAKTKTSRKPKRLAALLRRRDKLREQLAAVELEISREESRALEAFQKDVAKIEKKHGLSCNASIRCKPRAEAKKSSKKRAKKSSRR